MLSLESLAELFWSWLRGGGGGGSGLLDIGRLRADPTSIDSNKLNAKDSVSLNVGTEHVVQNISGLGPATNCYFQSVPFTHRALNNIE